MYNNTSRQEEGGRYISIHTEVLNFMASHIVTRMWSIKTIYIHLGLVQVFSKLSHSVNSGFKLNCNRFILDFQHLCSFDLDKILEEVFQNRC
jgi:hypothetical protein